MSDYLENQLVDDIWRARAWTKPTVLGHALYTAAPGETGGGTEVSGGSYARVDLPPLFSNWRGTGGETTATDSAGTGGLTDNGVIITFATPTANWGLVTDVAQLDATSGGNFLVYGSLTTSKTINNGDDAPTFPVGDFDITLA